LKARRVVALAIALVALPCLPVWGGQEERNNVMTSDHSTRPSDREKNGVHGPVRSVIEEKTYAAWTDADGKVSPDFKSWSKIGYDRDGRIAETRFRGSSREHGFDGTEMVTRYSYDATGQLLRKTRQNGKGDVEGEVIYHYDDQGRLQSITDSKDPNNPIAFRYDASGKKAKIAIAQPLDLPQGLGAVSRSVEAAFDVAGSAAALPEGGSALTLYDEHDWPTEVQTRDANGEVKSRALRVYDSEGRVLEEKEIVDDPLKMLAGGDQKKILASGDVSPQELRDQLAQFLVGSEMWSIRYTYDAQGHRSKMIRRVFNHMEEQVETSFNEHGDIAKETTQSTMRETPNGENDSTEIFETVYSYEYDSYGNWTMMKSSSRPLPDGTFKDTGNVVHRTIEYF
jgi:YD repeat-containing protein